VRAGACIVGCATRVRLTGARIAPRTRGCATAAWPGSMANPACCRARLGPIEPSSASGERGLTHLVLGLASTAMAESLDTRRPPPAPLPFRPRPFGRAEVLYRHPKEPIRCALQRSVDLHNSESCAFATRKVARMRVHAVASYTPRKRDHRRQQPPVRRAVKLYG
jgi:hypothetical protein